LDRRGRKGQETGENSIIYIPHQILRAVIAQLVGYELDDRGSRVRFPEGLGIFLFITASRTALGPTHLPIQWVTEDLSVGVKRPRREADHSPPARSKNAWSYTSSSQYAFMAWCSVKAQGQLYLYLSPDFTTMIRSRTKVCLGARKMHGRNEKCIQNFG
jgi:hypothetical protein